MDEARESQEMPAEPPLPLQYANRVEAADALRVYRLVGTALVLYYCGIIAGMCVSAAGYYQMGMGSWSVFLSPGITVIVASIGLTGALCMVRQLRVGARLVMGVAALQICAHCLSFFAQTLIVRQSRPGIFLLSAGGMTSAMLQSAAIGLLAYLFWDHCRKRGAWG